MVRVGAHVGERTLLPHGDLEPRARHRSAATRSRASRIWPGSCAPTGNRCTTSPSATPTSRRRRSSARRSSDAVGPVSRYPTAAGQRELRAAVAELVRAASRGRGRPGRARPAVGRQQGGDLPPAARRARPGRVRSGTSSGATPGYPVYGRGAMFAGGVSDPVTLTAEDGWRLDLGALPADRPRPRVHRVGQPPAQPDRRDRRRRLVPRAARRGARARRPARLRRVLPGGVVRRARAVRARGGGRRPDRRARVRVAVEAVRA